MILSTLIYILEIIGLIWAIIFALCLLVFIIGCAVKAVYWLAKVITNPDEPLPEPSDDWLE